MLRDRTDRSTNGIDNHSHLRLNRVQVEPLLNRKPHTMYICICKAVTDGQIRAAVEDGVTSMSGLRESLGCAGQCGKCGKHVKQIRDEALADQGAVAITQPIPVSTAA